MNIRIIFFLLLLAFITPAEAKAPPAPPPGLTFNVYKNAIGSYSTIDSLFTATALYFLNTSYVASTLENDGEEMLTVNFREVDCTTFVENCMALTRTVQQSESDFEMLCGELQKIRYRDGIINGYPSRLHYIADWIYDNEQKEIIRDRTREAGGEEHHFQLSFMSTHPASYPALTRQPEHIGTMQQIEKDINSRENTYFIISKEKIPAIEQNIHSGNIIFFTTSIKGLDVLHAGIAYRKDDNDTLTFIHASSKFKSVVINPESLSDYCLNNKNITGIMVVELLPGDK